MHSRKQQWIVVFIAGVIGFTLVTQMYWNYKNYQVGKRQLMNDVQTSLDKAVDTYYVELAKERSLQWKGDSIHIQSLSLDSIFVNRDSLKHNGKTITLILIQGILTAADIYLVNLSILFIPLGECYDLCAHTYNRDACNYDTFVTGVAMTIAFTNPIFALLFNAVIMKKCPGILKIFLVACLVAGVALILQPRVVSSQTADGEHATSITKK